MDLLPLFPESYWQKFSEYPVVLQSCDIRAYDVAQKYIDRLRDVLSPWPSTVLYHRGSTALGIVGKGDIEIGVIPPESEWFSMIVFLSQHYAGLGNLDEEYCRCNDEFEGFPIEITLFRGYNARLDQKVLSFLQAHPEWRYEYERVKQEACFSQRAYNQAKDVFFRKLICEIPA